MAEPKARRVPKSETRERRKRVTVRFLDSEFAVLESKAEAAGLSLGSYMRACSLGDPGPRAQRSPSVNRELAAQAIAELNKAGSNLNQIAHGVNMAKYPAAEAVREACTAVQEAARQILRSFGFQSHDR
jgi:hypothetical protein